MRPLMTGTVVAMALILSLSVVALVKKAVAQRLYRPDQVAFEVGLLPHADRHPAEFQQANGPAKDYRQLIVVAVPVVLEVTLMKVGGSAHVKDPSQVVDQVNPGIVGHRHGAT